MNSSRAAQRYCCPVYSTRASCPLPASHKFIICGFKILIHTFVCLAGRRALLGSLVRAMQAAGPGSRSPGKGSPGRILAGTQRLQVLHDAQISTSNFRAPNATLNVQVEAEEVTEVSLRYEVAVVPLFLFFKVRLYHHSSTHRTLLHRFWKVAEHCSYLQDGKLVDKLEGADVAALSGKVAQHCPAKAGASGKQAASVLAPSNGLDRLAPGGTAAATEKVKALIHSQPVMLFMKGSPDAPRCGFSSRVVAVLQKLGVPFGHFDILTDEAVRQAAKVRSQQPMNDCVCTSRAWYETYPWLPENGATRGSFYERGTIYGAPKILATLAAEHTDQLSLQQGGNLAQKFVL